MSKTLKPEYQELADDFEVTMQHRGCSCHISPPCSFCTHEGNPANLAETDEAWEEEVAHTPEPWQYKEQGDADEYCFITQGTPEKWVLGFRANGEMHSMQQKANARRIVACVNACAGIDTDMIEATKMSTLDALRMLSKKTKTKIENIGLLAQRDELLATLKVIVEAGGIGPEDMFDDARDVIRKVEASRG